MAQQHTNFPGGEAPSSTATDRKMGRQAVIGGLIVGLVVGLAAAHHLMARGDRIAAEIMRVRAYEVRDEVLRYELERGALPKNLDELVPAYVRQDQLIGEDGEYLYRFEPASRMLAQAKGTAITGIWTTHRDPVVLELPPPPARDKPLPDAAAMTGETPASEPPQEVGEVDEPTVPAVPETQPAPPGDFLALEVPKAMRKSAPPRGALVFEAEHYTDTNYGWEITRDDEAGFGAYLHCKEGVANGPGQTRHEMGDFYNVRGTKEFTYLKYHLHLKKPGAWFVYGRMWTTDTKCSNAVCAAFDQGGPYTGSIQNRLPFRWVWSPMAQNPQHLPAGDHYLHIFIHEDGVRFDQFILSPVPLHSEIAYAPNLMPGADTEWEKSAPSPVHLTFDYKSMVIDPETPPEVNVVLRRLKKIEGRDAGSARLKAVLRGAGEGGTDVVLADGEVDLGQLKAVSFLKLDFGKVDLAKLPRREYLLEADLRRGEQLIAASHVPLMRPWAWEALGPGRYIEFGESGPLDGDENGDEDMQKKWKPFKPASFDHFGVLDFGAHTTGNMRHPPEYKTIYVRTRIHVPKAGPYMLKVQADDQAVLWLDGREIYRHEHTRPVTRAGFRVPVELPAGDHRLRMRINQRDGRWQASVRFRTPEDDLSGVTGLETPLASPAQKE